MSNDKKTLADAQPGGRVRLGDQALSTSEGSRRYVADFFATQLRRHDFGDYILTEMAADFACALAQHLSAQPSPGGQGDASHYWPEVDRILVDAYVAGSEGDEFDMIAARNAIHAALAARQPAHGSGTLVDSGALQMALNVLRRAGKDEVADALESTAARQPVEVSEGGFRAAASRQTASAESNATAEALIAAARQPSKQPDSVALGEATEFCIEKGDHQPVGESVWVEVRREGDRTFPRVMKRDQADAFLRSCNVGPLPTIHSLYATAPAQAVDLGQFRQPVQDWLDDAQASMEEHGDYDGVFGHAIEEGTRLLALIDRQAVGNG